MSDTSFILSKTAPNPTVYKYWVDLSENPYGGIIKFYNGKTWDYVNNKDEQDESIDAIVKGITDNYVSSVTTNANNINLVKTQTKYSLNNGVLTPSTTTSNVTVPAATTSQAGIMSAADKTLLNQLQSNYTALEARVAALETA